MEASLFDTLVARGIPLRRTIRVSNAQNGPTRGRARSSVPGLVMNIINGGTAPWRVATFKQASCKYTNVELTGEDPTRQGSEEVQRHSADPPEQQSQSRVV